MITILDPGQTLTAAQAQTLTAKAAAYPFDLHVYISTGADSRLAFDQRVDQAVTPGSRLVSIGVDPTHHFTHEHASASLGIPSGPVVASAGNPFFKQGNLVEGIDAIAAKANELRVETRTIQSQTGAPIVIHEHHTATGVWWALGGFCGLIIAVTVWAIWRAKKRDREALAAQVALNEEAAELRARNLEEQDWADRLAARRQAFDPPRPGVVPITNVLKSSYAPGAAFQTSYVPSAPSPAPVVINQQSNNNGALDMLVGMELERSLERDSYRAPPIVEREVIVERESSGSSSSSSSWFGSDDSSSSSSFDSGSSSDSSSSSDWGGGSDSGGSSSDGGW